jgi:hypothetical protein
LAKCGEKTWCFGGEFVVGCVVKRGAKRPCFCARKM